jgi:hypothetical protein
MKTYDIYFHDLRDSLRDEIARAHGYATAEEFETATNSEIVPLAEIIIYDKNEEPPE